MRRTERSRLNQFHSFIYFVAALAALSVFVFSTKARGAAAQSAGAANPVALSAATSLASAPTAQLLKIYAQLRSLQGSDQSAVLENVSWKRDAATFTFKDGTLTFAAPVAGRVVAAVFTGDATVELDPPTSAGQRQIARFTGKSNLVDGFKRAVFFFTDDSWDQLQKLVTLKPRGDAGVATKALDAAETRYQQNDNDWWENQRKGNFVMQNLAARMMADLTDPSSQGLFLADIHAERHGNLLYEVSWNRKTTLLPGISNGDEVMLLHYVPGQYSEWWAGFHLAAEYLNNPHPEHPSLPAHCEQEAIDATISKSNHLSATAQMDFTVQRGTPRMLPFNLLGVLRISAVTDEDGKPVGFIQEDRNLDNDPWLILPQPAVPGHPYTVKITYDEDSTRDSRVIYQLGSGLYYVPERASWYPSFGAFDDRTNFKLHFLSPKNDQFVATGKQVDSKKEKDGWVSDYVSQIPFSVVGFNYGDFVDKSVSDKTLTVTAYAGKEVPDQLKGLESALDLAQMAQGPNGGDIDGQYGILRGGFNTAAGAKYAAAKSYQAFRLYEAYFGPLPFKSVAVTEQPVGNYGQSFPTLIFLPYLSLLDETTLNSLRLESKAESREFFDVVAVHEMSHQWWGHMVGWKTYHDQWLSEGFADFSAALYLQMYEPKKLKDFWDLDRTHLLSKDSAGHRPVDVGPIWLNYQTDSYLEPGESYELRYGKGSYVLWMLRTIMQDQRSKNPDANFIAMMRDFVQTYAGKNASTEDFERIAEKHYGRTLAWFFNEWVYGTDIPTYNFQYQLSDAPQGKTLLHMTLTQSGVSNSFGMDVPVYVYLQGQPHFVGFIVIQGSRSISLNARLPVHPEKVAIDVDHSLLAIEHQ